MSLVIAAITDAIMIFFVDYTLNILCIMLMTGYYKEWYRNLCCCCIRSCIVCCLCNKEQQKVYITYHMAKSINTKSTADKENTSTNDGESGETVNDKDEETTKQQTYAESTNDGNTLNVTVVNDDGLVSITDAPSDCENNVAVMVDVPSNSVVDNMKDLRKENEKLKDMVKQMENKISEKRKSLKDVEVMEIGLDRFQSTEL